MADFKYRAIGPGGAVEEGTVSALDLNGAREILRNRGYTPIRIDGGKQKKILFALRSDSKLSLRELVYFCRQLSTILNAGVSLANGLVLLRRQNLTRNLRTEVNRLLVGVQSGRSLSEVMQEAGGRYPGLLVNTIAAGELSGSLDSVMKSLASYFEREAYIRQKLQSMMIYPSVLAVTALGMVAFFINYLLPEMVNMLKESGAPMPFLTNLIINASNVLRNYFWGLFILLPLCVAAFIKMLAKPKVKPLRDRLVLKIPVISGLVRTIIHARFARTLGILLKSGVPLLQALESLNKVIDNSLAEKGIKRAIDGLRRGEAIAINLASANFFDDLFIQFIGIGEETGELENILDLMHTNYELQTETAFSRLTAMVEPAMTLVMGFIVGGVVLSVILPMFNMLDAIKRH